MSAISPEGFMLDGREMPRYKCHKEVWALKIKSFQSVPIVITDPTSPIASGGLITPEEEGYAPFTVSRDYVSKHDPKAGGYFVVYKDGYQSFSPREPFDEGYTRVT